MKPLTSKKIFYIWLLLIAFAFTFCSILLKVFTFQVVGLIFQACVLIITLSSLVLNCHSKRKLREQAAVDAEAAIAAQINRAFEKEAAKEDPPPEYELPPTYVEAMKRLETEERNYEKFESEFDKSLSEAIKPSSKTSISEKPAKSEDESSSKSLASSLKCEDGEVTRTNETHCHI